MIVKIEDAGVNILLTTDGGELIYAPKNAVYSLEVDEPLCNFSWRDDLYEQWYTQEIDFNDITDPTVTNAQDVADYIKRLMRNASGRMWQVAAGDFSGGNTYTPTGARSLKGLTADIDFAVYGEKGAGTLLALGSGYDFDSPTGAMDMTNYGGATDLRIQII